MKKVLVVDDDPNIVELIKLRLESNDFEVETASDGVEALQTAESFEPDLIILDVSMPSMDGYSFVQEVKWHKELRGIPILILTAREHTFELFKMEGIESFMSKPFESKELISNIEGCLKT